jgi:hypothetical protein
MRGGGRAQNVTKLAGSRPQHSKRHKSMVAGAPDVYAASAGRQALDPDHAEGEKPAAIGPAWPSFRALEAAPATAVRPHEQNQDNDQKKQYERTHEGAARNAENDQDDDEKQKQVQEGPPVYISRQPTAVACPGSPGETPESPACRYRG